MEIKRFEDLDCWKVSRELVKTIYQMTRLDQFKHDYGLKDQLQRAAVSVMANVAEGYATFHKLEFVRFLGYSIRSAFEVQSHLYAALDLGYISREDFDSLYIKALDCANLCKGMIRYLKIK